MLISGATGISFMAGTSRWISGSDSGVRLTCIASVGAACLYCAMLPSAHSDVSPVASESLLMLIDVVVVA